MLEQIAALDGFRINKVRARGHASAAVTSSGDLFLWGRGFAAAPQRQVLPARVRDVALGTNFACALDEDGRVFAWGCNRSGELGVGDLEWRTEPTEVGALFGKVVKSLQCGGQHVIALGSGEQPVAPPAQARSKSREAVGKSRRRAGGRETSPLREKGTAKHSKSAKGLRSGGEGAERVRLIEAEDELMHKSS